MKVENKEFSSVLIFFSNSFVFADHYKKMVFICANSFIKKFTRGVASRENIENKWN